MLFIVSEWPTPGYTTCQVLKDNISRFIRESLYAITDTFLSTDLSALFYAQEANLHLMRAIAAAFRLHLIFIV